MSVETEPRRRRVTLGRIVVFAPLALFLGLALLFLFQLFWGEPDRIPSALIGRPVPEFTLPPVDGLDVPGLSSADLADGEIHVVNVWASWCVPCRDEHPMIEALSADGRIRVVGINYKDAPDNARRFLGRYGNPFAAIGADRSGRVGIDWGVYGVPETFLVGRDGTILYKHIGPITPTSLETDVKPAIERALAGAGAG